MQLRGVGIWSGDLRGGGDPALAVEAAAELDELGYTALWMPNFTNGPLVEPIRLVLDASERLVAATGILNVWERAAERTADDFQAVKASHPDRFLLGLGISHAALVDREHPGRYQRPLANMCRYLDELDAIEQTAPRDSRVLAALGPRMLELARDRAAGAHPYFVPPEHTVKARELLGDALLAPEQAVLLERDPGRARELARSHMAPYLELPNYVNNLLRLGFDEGDLKGGASDRLTDAIVAWGDAESIRARVQAHFDAGADHVCVQVIHEDVGTLPVAQWRELAPVLTGVGAKR
jgi:probable F420-dependent oxidoreductase